MAEESAADPSRVDFANATRDITANMLSRASGASTLLGRSVVPCVVGGRM
eukprot:SAG31_NODE_45928_length_256_cov_1.611465_1_plen_49_part_10